MPRRITNKVLEMAEEGMISWESLALMALKYMSEDDVSDMANANDLFPFDDEEEDY